MMTQTYPLTEEVFSKSTSKLIGSKEDFERNQLMLKPLWGFFLVIFFNKSSNLIAFKIFKCKQDDKIEY